MLGIEDWLYNSLPAKEVSTTETQPLPSFPSLFLPACRMLKCLGCFIYILSQSSFQPLLCSLDPGQSVWHASILQMLWPPAEALTSWERAQWGVFEGKTDISCGFFHIRVHTEVSGAFQHMLKSHPEGSSTDPWPLVSRVLVITCCNSACASSLILHCHVGRWTLQNKAASDADLASLFPTELPVPLNLPSPLGASSASLPRMSTSMFWNMLGLMLFLALIIEKWEHIAMPVFPSLSFSSIPLPRNNIAQVNQLCRFTQSMFCVLGQLTLRHQHCWALAKFMNKLHWSQPRSVEKPHCLLPFTVRSAHLFPPFWKPSI